jgi:O-antigen/teichoic acid export membrane protein
MIAEIIKGQYSQYCSNPKIKQILLLYAVNVISIPISILTSVILTAYLGAKDYGNFQFLNNLFYFAVIIFTFGFFQAGTRALVQNENAEKAREYYGASLILLAFLFITSAIALTGYALFDANLQRQNLDTVLLWLIPFSWVFILTSYFEVLFQADNRIKLLSISRIAPKVGFLFAAIIICKFFNDKEGNNHANVWFFYLLTQIISFFYILYKLKLSFKNLKRRTKEIWNFNKSFGFDVYLGSVLGVGLAQLTPLFISYFGEDNSGVGFYALALTISTPLLMIPNTLGITHYKEFAGQTCISKKLTSTAVLISFLSLVALWIITAPFINIFYGRDFEPVVNLTLIVSVGMLFHGLADFFNRFIGSHGQGKLLKNSAIIVGVSLFILNIGLVPVYGEKGAAYTRLLSGIIYFACVLVNYLKFSNRLQSGSPVNKAVLSV